MFSMALKLFGTVAKSLVLCKINAFNSAVCRITSVFLLITAVLHYIGQTDICSNILDNRHRFLRKCTPNPVV